MPRQLNPASSLPAEPCGSPPPASSRAPHAVRGHRLIPMPRSRLRRGSRLCFPEMPRLGMAVSVAGLELPAPPMSLSGSAQSPPGPW